MSETEFRLPPLNALRVFWAVMRKGSFRAAADALLVSPQAVSQQIRQLEDILGLTLFERKGRVVEPTEAAIVLSHFVDAGFAEFEQGIRRITKTGARTRININVSPYFATRYLMQRLEGFRAQMPGIDLRISTMVETPDFARDEVDVSIQWGFRGWQGYDSTLLVRDPKILCCTAPIARDLRQPRDLVRQTLLYPVLARDLWARVLGHLGVVDAAPEGVLEFQDAATLRRAALSGLGVGLISDLDARADIAAGRLVAPFGIEALADLPSGDVPGFYILAPRAHKRVTSIATFWDWITGEDWDAVAASE